MIINEFRIDKIVKLDELSYTVYFSIQDVKCGRISIQVGSTSKWLRSSIQTKYVEDFLWKNTKEMCDYCTENFIEASYLYFVIHVIEDLMMSTDVPVKEAKRKKVPKIEINIDEAGDFDEFNRGLVEQFEAIAEIHARQEEEMHLEYLSRIMNSAIIG